MRRGLTAAIVCGALALVTPTHAAAQDTGPGTGGLELVEQTVGARPTENISIVLQLPGVIAPGDGLTLTVHEPVTDEAEFLATADGEELGGVLGARQFALSDLRPDAFGIVGLSVRIEAEDRPTAEVGPDQPEPLILARAGVYPVRLELRTSSQELVGRIVTHIIRLPAPQAVGGDRVDPVQVVLVADITGQPASSMPAIDWLAVLARHPDLAITAAITPEIFDLLAGTPELQGFVDTGSRRHLVRLPYFRVDEAALDAAGLEPELETLLTGGDARLTVTGQAASPTLWLSGDATDTDTLRSLHSRGVREVVVGADSLAEAPTQPPRRPIEITADDVIQRALLLEELASPLGHDSPAAGAQRIASQLATIAFTGGGDEIVAIDVSALDVADATALLDQLAALPLIETVTAGEALGQPLAIDASRLPVRLGAAEPEAASPSLGGYTEAKQLLTAYRSMIRDEDTAEHDRLATELLRSLSEDVALDARNLTWRRVVDFVRQQASLVDAPPEQSINLTSRTADVPFSFQNRSDTAVRVEVRFISDKLRIADFDDGESTTIVLVPGVTNHEFSLEALSTGSFPLAIELHSPDGTLLIGRTRTAIRSTTPTGVGLGLTVGAALFLVVWWAVDMRRRRMV